MLPAWPAWKLVCTAPTPWMPTRGRTSRSVHLVEYLQETTIRSHRMRMSAWCGRCLLYVYSAKGSRSFSHLFVSNRRCYTPARLPSCSPWSRKCTCLEVWTSLLDVALICAAHDFVLRRSNQTVTWSLEFELSWLGYCLELPNRQFSDCEKGC